ncbi:site-specific DNA-methyltransferase [Desulfosporosinus sp. FKA]|uniref:site-specific DNA-methyltransferase n=1 Tax=Desulfosporosinus sp. FKA TaxID=1969834 RepID=UPI000B49D139|nr:site-specific DNA-methyltransferase [Desulfosporosinus sp. FKA]
MTELNGKTPDVAFENIKKLKSIFPDVFSEGKINFDKLKQVLGEYLDDEKERYNFSWNGKGKALRLSQTPSMGTLRPCKEESKDWDTTQNLYIEGDNLEVLKLLQKTYYNKIKMIYIDPPYNTGGDFVYTDNFTDSIENYKKITGQKDESGNYITTNSESNGRYHTNWLNMMYPRIRLARNLLTDNGVIFISIDDNEVDNLKKICNEVFGEDNFLACISNINNPKGRSDDKYFATAHEYILVYKKYDTRIGGFEPEENVLKRYNKVDNNGKKYRHIDLRKTGDSDKREDRPKMFYYFMFNENTGDFYPTYDEDAPEGYIKIFPTRDDGSYGRWRLGIETAKERIEYLTPNYMAIKNKWTIVEKDYLSDDLKVKPTTVWNFKDVNSERGTEQFIDLNFDKTVFPRPKPLGTINRILKISTKDDDIVLDFFSGSASTAHAIMQLNNEDFGKRRFIMVQLPELVDEKDEAYKAGYKNICEIGKERIRRAGDKLKGEAGLMADELDIGFKVFKLDYSNLKKWNPDYDNLELSLLDIVSNYVDDRTEEDVVYEIMLKMGLDLTYPIEETTIAGKKIYSIGFGALMICLDDDITTDVANGMVIIKNEVQPETWKVVFKDNGFASDSVKTNVKEILKCAGLEEDAFTTV